MACLTKQLPVHVIKSAIRVQIMEKVVSISLCTNAHGKGIEIISPH